jgi:hypothetical protein
MMLSNRDGFFDGLPMSKQKPSRKSHAFATKQELALVRH